MITATDLKNGTTFLDSDKPYKVVKYNHIKMGRGGATVRVVARNLETGDLAELTYDAGNKIDEISTSKTRMQYLYKDDDTAFFMNPMTYEQVEINLDVLGETVLFIKEGIKSIIQNVPMLLIDIFAVIGVIFYRKEIKFKKILKFTLYYTLISLIIGTGFWFLFDFGNTIPFLNGILAYRFVYYARLGLFIFAAYALYKIFDENIKQKWLQLMKIKKKYVITAILLILVIGFSLGTYFPPKSYTQTFPQAPIYKETQEVWNWLSENIQPNEVRILNQNFFDNIGEPSVTGDSIASALASKETGLFFFGSWYTTVYPIEKKAKTENKYLFGEKINTISDESIKTHMEIYNLKYAIAVSKELQERLEASNLFTIEKEFETYKIYILKEYTPSWIASEQLVEVQEFTLAEQTMDFTVDNPVNQQVIVKFAYHPYWKAFMDGVEIPLGTNEWYLMSLQLQEGIHQIHLEYAPKNTAVNIISLGAFIGVILLLLNNKRYKRKKEKEV